MRFSVPALSLALLGAAASHAVQTDVQLGQSSFGFLKLPLSPRAIAMGGAGAGLADGLGEAEINPAAAARDSGSLILGQEYPPQQFGTTGNHISWALPWDGKRVTLHARYLGFDKIPGYDASSNATTAYDAYTIKLQAGLAGWFRDFAYGASLSFAQNNVADATYGAAMINAGLWRALPYGFSAGASVMNADLWTGSTKTTGEKVIPPVILQGGLAYARALRPGMRATVAVDARKVNDEGLVFPAGAELNLRDALFIRAGYPIGDADHSFDLGVGLRWTRFGFNYAYKAHSTLAGDHSWTLEIRE